MNENKKSIFVWSPFTGKVGTVQNVINSLYSINKYSKFDTTLINAFGEWDNYIDESKLEKVVIHNFKFLRFIFYGIIQGLTEFIPVSSTAHLKIISLLFGINDPRSTKPEDSWVRVKSFAPSMVIVATNFYCISSAKVQREFTEDILLMARSRAEENNLVFHEPRKRQHHQQM